MVINSQRVIHRVVLLLVAVAAGGLCSCSTLQMKAADGSNSSSVIRQRTLLDVGWSFHLGDISPRTDVISTSYDDTPWRRVDLPHDYVLEGTHTKMDDIPGRSHGYLPVSVAWYRKHLVIPESDNGKVLTLDFDGAFRDSQVWFNGQLLGRHPSGYTPFSYDITKLAKYGVDNVIAVRVDPREFEGHWYEGGGIYRHVYLTALAPLHVARWGTYVVSTVPNGEKGASDEATLTIQSTIENSAAAPANFEVISEIVAPNGQSVQTLKAAGTATASAQQEVVQKSTIPHPKLWSLEAPGMYQLRTTLLRDGKAVDSTVTTFGIRTIHFDADKGFFLNGQHVQIQGAANHQDFAGVGLAVPDSLQAWRVAQLKKFGCNGWRTAHNMVNEPVLDACDNQGMLVMAENRHLGDAYGSHSPPGTKADDLSDLAAMIRRDRNHPSIIMWSLCNEEGLRAKAEGKKMFAQMTTLVKKYDATRPITCAINGSWIADGIHDEDIIGVNYHWREYDAFRKGNPTVPMFASEGSNEKTTRGEYENNPETGMKSAYDFSENSLQAVLTRPWLAGIYMWTGFDYKGEPNPFGWPDISNHTGLLDTCGFPKDKAYYFQSCWSDQPMVHLLPASWNWPGKEGQNVRVVAFSNASRVELFLNGKSLGTQDVPRFGHAEWQVPYSPGELLAKAYTKGKTVAQDLVETTGSPVRIEIKTDRTALQADGQDAVVVAVSLLDVKGRIVPDADRRITFALTGGGKILGVGNGNPADHDTDKADNRNTFHGRCIAVLQSGTQKATLRLTASSPGLTSDAITLKVR